MKREINDGYIGRVVQKCSIARIDIVGGNNASEDAKGFEGHGTGISNDRMIVDNKNAAQS